MPAPLLIVLTRATYPLRRTQFYQIVSTFLKSLDIPWPSAFGIIMARTRVLDVAAPPARADVRAIPRPRPRS